MTFKTEHRSVNIGNCMKIVNLFIGNIPRKSANIINYRYLDLLSVEHDLTAGEGMCIVLFYSMLADR